jgi:hypothetical protein
MPITRPNILVLTGIMEMAKPIRGTSHGLVDAEYCPKELYNSPSPIRCQRIEARKGCLFPADNVYSRGLNNHIVTMQGLETTCPDECHSEHDCS